MLIPPPSTLKVPTVNSLSTSLPPQVYYICCFVIVSFACTGCFGKNKDRQTAAVSVGVVVFLYFLPKHIFFHEKVIEVISNILPY